MDKLASLKDTDWFLPLNSAIGQEDYFPSLLNFLISEYDQKDQTIYPSADLIFNAYQKTSLAETKVIILGQDPYHQVNQAIGLSFAVNSNVKMPPSLVNIIKELEDDLNIKTTTHDLIKWAEQGVLLLNSTLTVIDSQPNSHVNMIWEALTDATIKLVSDSDTPKVFILWGKFAQAKKTLIDQNKHLVIESAHPSPLSAYRGFFGSKPFSRANHFLVEKNQQAIDWSL